MRTISSTILASILMTTAASAQIAAGACTEQISQLPDYMNGFKSDAQANTQVVAEQVNFATPVNLNSVSVWGIFNQNGAPSNNFTMVIHADSGGLPGAVLYSESGVTTTLVATGMVTPPPLVTADEYMATLTPAASVSLPAGPVWFEIFNDAGAGSHWSWLTGAIDPVSGVGGASITFDAPGVTFFNLNPDMAMVVCATPGGLATEGCNGDGGDQMGCTNCPCGNDAPPGTIGGCINSAGTSTRLNVSGSSSVAAADLRCEASGAPPFISAILTSGNAIAPQNPANPCFGTGNGVQATVLDGLRCAVQGVLRHGVRPSDASGDIGITTNGWGDPNGFFNFSAFVDGQTKHFQIFHRDDDMQVCQTGQNTSQSASVTFTP